ncbi:MAG: DUF3320 domain-containing protein, partial [Planctomycetota bacterium]
GIEPLALERYEPGGAVTLPVVPDGVAPAGAAPVSEPTGREGPGTESPDAATADPVERRIARWRDRLLDLTLRNRLIAFRPGASGSIPLVVPSPQALFDRLETGGALQLVAAPPKRRRSGARGDDRAALARELAAGRLPVPLAEPELERRLRALGRRARALLREQGASPLYVALGLLRWSEDESGEPQRFAPLVLVPVELERASARERYRLRRGEDEPRLNRTLCEKLRIDFGLDVGPIVALDRDDAPPAFEAVLEAFTRAIARIDRWDVLPACHLALFSFTKFVMWHDLAESADRLLESMLVRGLARGDLSALARASAPLDEARLDALSPPERTYLVADADSSQLAAVLAAADGRSFVLQGPPGTGKSQTITNLIAHAIASGRTVLFVSEKMAALEVVRGRLERVGLGGLCLEVHAHRGGKRRVVEQLARALRAERPDPARTRGQWARLSGKLAEARQVLDASVRRLHERDGWGLSAFEAIDRLTALGDGPAVAPALERARPDPDRLERWREAAAELGELAAPLAPLPQHPFAASALTEWSPALEARLDTELEVLRGAQQRLAQVCEALGEALGRRLPDTFAALRAGAQLAQTLLEAPGAPVALWELVSESERAAERVGAWLEIGRRRAALRERLFAKRWRPALLEQDLAALERAVREASGRGWLGRWWARRSLARRLAPVLAEGAELGSLERAAADLARARKLAALEARWREADRFGQRCFGDRWPRADEVEAVLGWAGRLREALAELEAQLPADERGAAWLERLVRLVGFVPERGRRGAEATVLRERLEAFVAAWRRCERALETVNASLRLEPERVWGPPGEPGLLDRVARRVERLHAALASLRPWAWLRARCEALLREEPALQPLVDALYGGTIEPQAAVAAFERGLLRRWLRERIESEPLLGRFHRAERERWLERFRRLDREHIEAAAEVVRALLGERLPVGAGSERAVAEASEVGLLLREARKKRAHLPLRRLFARIPHLLPRLAPCLLMSPLSVASHLEPGGLRFDLVVFDEASQIPTHEAIGAIARGRQLVVVGDSRQLPPTTFFDRVIGEQEAESEADEDALVELESVLDECCASRMPEMSLRLHYRSRDEALIAFSNRHYYEGRLETFPAPVRVDSPGRGPLGVLWRPVPQGVYDRSGSRTNRAEAEAVVAEVVGALRDPDRRGRSIGVVTFSMAQQQLVEDLLEDARRAHPEIEPWFGDAVPEPVFVKNLENVQGDERDVIVLSVCYGPDASGRVRMHFGPLNREGGERRLNVAITRAREQLVVVSTLTPEQIDLGRTRARGVAHLKRFLAYARDGQRVLESLAAEAARHEASAIARALGEALRERGWEVAEGVGRSGWRIDLAASERGASHWRLGVIVDGPAFARAATVRVRERTREAVLASMGWRLHRVYALEWHFDREGVVARVHEAIERACAEAQAQPFEALLRARWRNVPDTSPAAGEPEPESESEADGGGGGETGAGAPPPVEPASPRDREGAPEGADGEVAVVGAAASGGEAQRPPGREAGGDGGAVRLAIWSVFASEAPAAPPERLFAEDEEAAIERRLLAVAEHEAPVHERELLRRVAAGWGHERLTARVRRRLEGLLERVVA